MSTYRAIDVAQYAVDLRTANGDSITPLQLMKVVYMCHGWMLGYFGKALVSDNFEAWKYGPVARELYDTTKIYGSKPVERVPGAVKIHFDDMTKTLIDAVVNTWADVDGIMLSAITHLKESPWDITISQKGHTNAVISDNLIEAYYKNEIRRLKDKSENVDHCDNALPAAA